MPITHKSGQEVHNSGPHGGSTSEQFSKNVLMWSRPFTRMHRIPVVKRVWFYLALMAAYTGFVDWLPMQNYPSELYKDASAAGAFGGLVLGLLLVFRTNSAYERWWEGRKLWGQLVNDTRNAALKIRALVPENDPQRKRFAELLISFCYALKHHLRDTRPVEPLPGVGDLSDAEAAHLPLHITSEIYEIVLNWRRQGITGEIEFLCIDQQLRGLMDICGSCERIKTSPIAVSYRAFMRQGIALNLLALPWYLTKEFPLWWSVPIILIAAYFLIGIELIAEDIEEPFGQDGDDLPLDAICSTVKTGVGHLMEVEQKLKFTTSMPRPRIDLLKDTGRAT